MGVYNLVAHFPENAIAPDLGIVPVNPTARLSFDGAFSGPKMYNSLSSIFDDHHAGSTRLHLDLSDAVNIMAYASKTADDSPGFAIWHIFAPEDSDRIRVYLRSRKEHGLIVGDPIHNQDDYLTPRMLAELKDEYMVRPYYIRQYVGDAVFIPAGCAHQVC